MSARLDVKARAREARQSRKVLAYRLDAMALRRNPPGDLGFVAGDGILLQAALDGVE
jgi:hypothetical protein